MKGLILCAGRGSRLYPLTRSYPKTLIPIANIPILQTCIEKLIEQEIDEIGIVIHPSQDAIIKEQIGNGERWSLKLTYILQDEPMGISDAIKQAIGFIGGDSFLLLLGDNLISESLSELNALVSSQRYHAALMLAEVHNPRDYGIAEVAGQRIVRLEEKPQYPRSNLAVIGAYAFSSSIFKAVAAIPPSSRGEYEITDAIQWLIDQGDPVAYHITDKRNFDVGTMERLLEANRYKLGQMESVLPNKTSVLENCRIIPPVAIGNGCVLRNCIIGPYASIGAGTSIEGCRVENSVIFSQVHLKYLPYHVKDTVIGFRSVLTGSQSEGIVTGQ
ncbi:sugar phosphate nucleotidyltransferase [Paenibacillus spongiae]|uniref:NTP transferase domain-containing protein n=1 Tax=Paenibacillus spongiae TaxID=2909671 RepID=A0ABY5S3Z1_9BACL|nr:sugar phosphate nucleotidyltransferase [Paenibacillus spongiae]UVI28626.1 NTP transferase domain-containing protein [Paenibacillus spongiae]